MGALGWLDHLLALVFSIGALMIYTLFYRSRLLPRWLAWWGVIGGALYITVPLLALYGVEVGFLMLPLAVQEMVMALWLIVKGFSAPATAAVPARAAMREA